MNNNQRSKRTQAQQRQHQPAAAVASGRGSGSIACPSILGRNALAKPEQAGAWSCPKN
jgi:hypothetical protein